MLPFLTAQSHGSSHAGSANPTCFHDARSWHRAQFAHVRATPLRGVQTLPEKSISNLRKPDKRARNGMIDTNPLK
jgi:hypothetical protein